jgi:hypothetical protein
MIATSSAFRAANAALAKVPIYIVQIEGYSRAFSSASGLGTVNGGITNLAIQLEHFGKLGFPAAFGVITVPNATPAGNILLVFASSGSTTSGSHSISDTAGNTWVPIFSTATALSGDRVSIWQAVAVASPAGNQITVLAPGSINSSYIMLELPAEYSGILSAHTSFAAFTSGASDPTATTSDGNVLSVPRTVNSTDVDLFMLSLIAPAAPNSGVAIGYMIAVSGGTTPSDSSQLIAQEGGAIVSGTQSTSADWLVSIEDLKITVSDLDGGADLADLSFTVQDRGQQITADLASFTFEGRQGRLLAGFAGMSVADYATLFTGQIDTVESANANTEYVFTASNINLKKLTQKIYTTGDDGFGIDSSHPHTIVGEHPLDILADALAQVGIPSTQIDIAKIQFYRDTIFNNYKFTFTLTSAPTAKDFIENELMKPLGMYLWVNNLGVISINSFYPAVSGNGTYTPPPPPVMTITTDQIMGMVVETEADLINQVIFDFDDDGSGGSKFLAEEIVDYDVSIEKYGLVGGHTIQSQGMRSASQGYFMSALIGRLICLRYGLKTMVLDPLTLFWSACTLEPGDIIAVTHPFLPDRVTGTVGITTKFFEVLDRNWKFISGQVELKLLAIDLSKFKQYQITPNAEASYAAASSADKARYMFQCGADGKYSTGATANTVG